MIVKMPHVNKKNTSEKCKFGSNKKNRPEMNFEWAFKNHKNKIKLPILMTKQLVQLL